jgi:O-6-methylguanine DNA methyltransferase
MNEVYQMKINTPFGNLFYVSSLGCLEKVSWQTLADNFEKNNEFEQQINLFFNRKIESFDLPLSFNNSAFAQSVLEEVQRIPFGKTATYHDIAQNIQKPNATQAVANALRNNPFALIIPCHRVVNKKQEITGYFGQDNKLIALRKQLLAFEKNNSGTKE